MSANRNFEVIKENKTKILNGLRGWEGRTLTTVNDQTFKITTMKRSSGNLTTSAMPVEARRTQNFETIQFDSNAIFNKTISLQSEKVSRVTEKAVKSQHYKALAIFDEMVSNGEIQPVKEDKPKVGSILFLDGYGKCKGSDENRHVVYKIENSQFGINYYTVELDTLVLGVKNYIKNINDKFGIGTYFEAGYTFEGSEDDLNNLIIEAKNLQKEKAKKKEAASLMRRQIRAAKIEEGKKLVNVPDWAKSVIVANEFENRSDSQTDYFHTASKQIVFLAFSKTTRNNMNELKKASQVFKETEHFISLLDNPQEGEEEIQEFTYGHSYLPDYFLGSTDWSGWKVSKDKYFDLRNPKQLEQLYIAAAEGRFLCKQEKTAKKKNIKVEGVEIFDYSEKSFAVIGETKPLKDDLKKLGGRFNFRLKCGAGWIFPKTKIEEIKEFLNTL